MLHRSTLVTLAAVSAALLLCCRPASAGTLAVQLTQPAAHELAVPVAAPISITFDRPVNPASVTSASLRVFGRWSGAADGAVSFAGGNTTLIFTPAAPFSAGEPVTVNLSHDLAAADGSPLRAAGYAFRFWTATRLACWNFEEIDTMSNYAEPPAQTRIYGAFGSDLNNDGWLDITTINEVSADLRVFLNRADGTGHFHPWLQPPAPGLFEMSPNEPADFDNDGNTDAAVAASAVDCILIYLGNGDGTFAPATIIHVGDNPLGIAVIDADGDGDIDVVNGNRGSNNLCLHVNDGTGSFAPPVYFNGGVNGEYGVAAEDMDNDGIFDLVVGGFDGLHVGVVRGNGDGTFTPMGTYPCGGGVWQVGTGDVNGDGWEDVHTANSFSANGAILLNLGGGVLGPAQTHSAGGHTPASDLGDFDGDGDLDWLLSSFSGGLWRLLRNDGSAAFTATQDFDAPASPGCGTAMDLDNDRRLDVVLLDEIADVVILMRNIVESGDTDCSGTVDVDDLVAVITGWGPCDAGPCAADVNGDGAVNVDDLVAVIVSWG